MKKILTLLVMGLCAANICFADENLSEQAKLFYAENNIRPAFDALISIPEDKRTSENWLYLGNILHDTQKNDDALYMYSQALIVNPKNYKALYNTANIYLEQDKIDDAIAEYKKAINGDIMKYQPLQAKLRVKDLGKQEDGFAADYDGTYEVKDILYLAK